MFILILSILSHTNETKIVFFFAWNEIFKGLISSVFQRARANTNAVAHLQLSICLITGVSQEIKKKACWIKSFDLNIREVQSSALRGREKKKANHYPAVSERKNQRLKAADCDTEGEKKALRCKEDRLIKERNHWRRKRERAPQIGKGKSGSFYFAFHLHSWTYQPIGLGAEPKA